MFLKEFYSGSSDSVSISAEQGDSFAKEIANDFNPLHDSESKRFCVPGDLLFALVLHKYGLSKKMNFTFAGMVGHGEVTLDFSETNESQFEIVASNGKTILKVERSGEQNQNESVVNDVIRNYVAFSGHNFPHILVPLMAEQKVMININRPFVIYDSMTLEFDHLNFTGSTVEMLDPELQVNGKRADAFFRFQIKADDKVVGKGFKKIVISGVREYEEQPMQAFVDNYLARKNSYLESIGS
jgi:aerobic-type carbon monoxide dehydrogenase small subunit (CoxS/CutS family)